MKKFALLFFLLALVFQLGAQNTGFDEIEYNGKVELTNGTAIAGDIFYDAATGKIVLKGVLGKEHYTARSASYFEFYDYKKNTLRKFYSLLYNNSPTFFELLKETSKLALLAKENVSTSKAVAYLTKSSSGLEDIGNADFEESLDSETLYLADDKGKIQPYVVINSNKLGTNRNYVAPYLLSALTKSKYQQIRKFAKENHYSLKNKEHLIEVLSFYEEILAN